MNAEECRKLANQASETRRIWALRNIDQGYEKLLSKIKEEAEYGSRRKYVRLYNYCESLDCDEIKIAKKSFKTRLKKLGFKCSWFGDSVHDFVVYW